MKYNIKDFFKQNYYREAASPGSLFPSYYSDWYIPEEWLFWKEYNEYPYRYDRRFYNMYRTFKPYHDIDDFELDYYKEYGYTEIESYIGVFQEDVFSFLTTNAKKYNELYRTYAVSDTDYMLLDNYNVTETMNKSTSLNRNLTVGSQTSNRDNKVSPYDSEDYYNDTSSTIVDGTRNDIDNSTATENHTFTRKGNIGVQTGSDMLKKHNNFWTNYEFYDMIFKDIAKEFLIV